MLRRWVRWPAHSGRGRSRCQAMRRSRMDSYLGEGARAGPASADLLLLHFLQNLLAAMVALGLGEQSLLTHAAQAAQAVFD